MPEHLIRYLHAAYVAPADGVADAELLGRCVADKDGAAFELLVRRHAGLVWRVCRAVAGDHHAAEDAFQATFLALARRAAAVRGRPVAAWLSKVAYHASLKARRRTADSHATLAVDPPAPAADPGEPAIRAELARALHDELNHLPDKYREPVALCHLHGLTQAEAAGHLGLALGTVATRVSRGLGRLRARLSARGVALSAGGLVTALSTDPACASPILVTRTAGIGPGAVAPSPAVAQLTTGVLSAMRRPTMTTAGLTAAAVLVLAIGGATLAVGSIWSPDPPPSAPVAPAAKPVPPGRSDYFARRASADRLHPVGQAIHAYADGHDDQLPLGVRDRAGKRLLSWRVQLLPYLDQDFLYSQFKLDEPWDSPHNKKLLAYVPKAYRTPTKTAGEGMTYLKGFVGPGASFDSAAVKFPLDFVDGTSLTMMAAEAGPAVPWTKPEDLAFDPEQPLPDLTGPFTDGFSALFADGSVWWVERAKLDDAWLRVAIKRDDGNFLPERPAGTRPPLNDREKEEFNRLWKIFVETRKRAKEAAEDRQRLTAELKAWSGSAEPDLPPDATLEKLERALKQLSQRADADNDEIRRISQELDRLKKK